jgi:hypothetical protein
MCLNDSIASTRYALCLPYLTHYCWKTKGQLGHNNIQLWFELLFSATQLWSLSEAQIRDMGHHYFPNSIISAVYNEPLASNPSWRVP